jgi:hypothetical protein
MQIGSATPGHITIDGDAAGYGWYVDATPGDDVEFAHALTGTRLEADPSQLPAGHIDLLTAVMHEMGHEAGLGDTYDVNAQDSLMYGFLQTGERRLPADHQADGATPGSVAEAAAFSAISIGTLPAGHTVTVQFTSTVTPPQTNQLVVNAASQASVTSSFPATTSNVSVASIDTLQLGDRVFVDANHNQLFDAGEGVAGVTLTLFADNGITPGSFDAGDTLLATTTSTGDGTYSFTGLAPGDYMVRVDQTNFTAGHTLFDGSSATAAISLAGNADPDNNADNDDNGIPFSGNGVVSQAISLNYNTETTADGTGQLDINNTLDFGFTFVTEAPPVVVAGGTVSFTEGSLTATQRPSSSSPGSP